MTSPLHTSGPKDRPESNNPEITTWWITRGIFLGDLHVCDPFAKRSIFQPHPACVFRLFSCILRLELEKDKGCQRCPS